MHTKNLDQIEPSHFTSGKALNNTINNPTEEKKRSENPFNAGGAAHSEIDLLQDQQPHSIWTSLFEGLKRLFNMSSDPEKAISPPPQTHDQLRNSYNNNNFRNSAHRGIIAGSIAPSNNDSGAKIRPSYLQNVQLEMQRVTNKQKGEKGN